MYVKTNMQPYNKERLTYCVHNGCVFKRSRLVVPRSLRLLILERLHDGHTGIVGMRIQAREFYWWPNIDRDTGNYAYRCTLCVKARNVPKNADLENWRETTYPFESVHMDICHMQNSLYLVMIDSFSKFVNVEKITSTTSGQVILCFWSQTMPLVLLLFIRVYPGFDQQGDQVDTLTTLSQAVKRSCGKNNSVIQTFHSKAFADNQ